jgi:DNA-binding response OmpR family regulator
VRSVNQHVYQLRRKLSQLPAGGEGLRIEALYGAGYRLAP